MTNYISSQLVRQQERREKIIDAAITVLGTWLLMFVLGLALTEGV